MDVARATQSIAFGALPGRTFGDAPFTVSAAGGASGNPVTFSAAGTCSVAGAVVSIGGAGACTVTAAQAGDANYEAAAPVAQTFTIAQAVPVIAWPAPADITLGTPLGTGQLNATANIAGAFIYVPPIGTLLPLGHGDVDRCVHARGRRPTTRRRPRTCKSPWCPPRRRHQRDRAAAGSDQSRRRSCRAPDLRHRQSDPRRVRRLESAARLAIDKRNGLISGQIRKRSSGEYQVQVTFTQHGVTNSRTFKWTVR
jgi:hypothetical protein